MSGLKNLLLDLARDADLQDQYKLDAKAVMKRYELSDEEIRAMLDKDLERVKALTGMDNLKSNGIIVAHDYE